MRSLLLLLLLASPAVAHDFTNGKVHEVLADYSTHMADMENQRYAVCGRGVRMSPYKGQLNERELIWVAMKDGRDNYHGRAYVTYNGRVSQVWNERISDKGKVHYRVKSGGANSSRFDSEVDDLDKETEIQMKADFASVHPMEFALAYSRTVQGGGSMYRRGLNVENLLQYELTNAQFNEQGDIVSEWLGFAKDGSTTNEARVVFAKEFDFLPVEVYADMVINKGGKEVNRVSTGQVNTKWEKIKDNWLPVNIEAQMGNKSDTVYNVDFRWKVGDEIPKSVDLVDGKLDDWNKPARDLFDETWQLKGMFPNLIRSRRK